VISFPPMTISTRKMKAGCGVMLNMIFLGGCDLLDCIVTLSILIIYAFDGASSDISVWNTPA
jgi:hypothetical protein